MATPEGTPQPEDASRKVNPSEDDSMREVFDPTFDLASILVDPDKQEHADDAVDYEDISDDDLPEEEDSAPQQQTLKTPLPPPQVDSFQTVTTDQTDPMDVSFTINGDLGADAEGEGIADFDDLFGGSSPPPADPTANDDDLDNLFGSTDVMNTGEALVPVQSIEHDQHAGNNLRLNGIVGDEEDDVAMTDGEEDLDEEMLEQLRLFKEAKGRQHGETLAPAPAQTQEEVIARMFPGFKKGYTLKFMDLLPSVRAHFVGKKPLKLPKAVLPTKISLSMQHDDEKDFRLLAGAHKRTYVAHKDGNGQRLIPVTRDTAKEEAENEVADEDSDYENEDIGGFSWQDFQVVCGDWDVASREATPELERDTGMSPEEADDDLFQDLVPETEWETGRPSAKRRKLEPLSETILQSMPRYEFPSLHDPAKATAKLAKGVIIDLNDPQLLVEEATAVDSSNSHETVDQAAEEQGDRRLQAIARRYNISNDHEYDLLKENHQSKSRSTIGNLTVSHSMPALRLQWPYYKTMLEKTETRSFHRPGGHFPKMETITFRPPRVIKKKHIKGQEPSAIFNKTEDLSLGDNSHVLLLEYSEQHPLMMSNFGMNSRLINYYRRKDGEDSHRPKLEIGELSVLQPQDVSPLTIFGHIDPGETAPAIYNGMFKAPLFAQDARPTDFVVVRNTTGVDGSNWFLRNIEYNRVVGQQFPSVEVPGPNARKVTTAAKNRLKMVSFRLLRRRKPHRIQVSEITPHILDPNGAPSNDMQNRQKLKEFMRFNKEHKEWEMPDGTPLPDEDMVRTLVAPEDVCLLEAMQVGQQQLKDAGYAQGVSKDEDAPEEEDDEGLSQSLEQQLVPWQTTKNFIQASNNKAMLQLYGEGDPTKRGEALSMLKISMKGGFKAEGESLNEKMDAQKLKENGGHSYNVAKQQEEYDRAVRKIWEKQKQALSSGIEPDVEPGEEEEEEEDDPVLPSIMDGPDVQTFQQQGPIRQTRDDESVSQFSRRSMTNQQQSFLKITRRVRTRTGEEEEKVEYVRDHRVIAQYVALRRERDEQNIDLKNLTQEEMKNPIVRKALEKELARLERNKDRRIGREKQRAGVAGPGDPGSPGTAAAATILSAGADGAVDAILQQAQVKVKGKGNTGGTGRKCANCGQVGHIKTNKKLCPMLNGTMRQEDSFREQEFSVSMANL